MLIIKLTTLLILSSFRNFVSNVGQLLMYIYFKFKLYSPFSTTIKIKQLKEFLQNYEQTQIHKYKMHAH